MKAAVYHSYGPPEVVQVKDVDVPVPKEDEVLVRVHFASVNRTDTGFRSAEYFISRFFSGLFTPKYQVLGCEFSGVVEKAGTKVTDFKVGERVFGFNDERFGAHAEYMLLREKDAFVQIPDGIDFKTASAISEGAHYALCNIRAAKIVAGQNILVNGGTGAIGSAAIQLIKSIGARVTAVCATPYLETVRSLGADHVIDYLSQDFTLLDEKFDVVFDAVGKSTFGKCKRILKEKGIYMSTELGPGAQNVFLAMITPFLGGKRLLFPLPSVSKDDIRFLGGLTAAGKLRPLIDRVYTIDQIVEAHRYAQSGQKIGNVLVKFIDSASGD